MACCAADEDTLGDASGLLRGYAALRACRAAASGQPPGGGPSTSFVANGVAANGVSSDNAAPDQHQRQELRAVVLRLLGPAGLGRGAGSAAERMQVRFALFALCNCA